MVEILKVPENKIHIVQPGIDFQKFNTKNSEVTKNVILKYSLPEDYILYLGTLEPRKNISSIIRAYGSLRNNNKITEKLVIAGKKGWLFSEIFDLIKSLDLGNEVILTDYVDESDKPAIYQNAKLFVFPSLYEGRMYKLYQLPRFSDSFQEAPLQKPSYLYSRHHCIFSNRYFHYQNFPVFSRLPYFFPLL